MKKISFASCLLIGLSYGVNAQYTHDAVTDFGRVTDVLYDLDDQNVLYAISTDNHIIVSEDNGISWTNLYNHPDIQVSINGLKTLSGGLNLSFIVTESSGETSIQILNTETGSVTAVIGSPIPESNISINDYDILGEDGSTVLIHLTHLDNSNQIQHKVYYTGDAGENWQAVYLHSENDGFVPAKVFIDPANPSGLFIARGASQSTAGGGGLLRSTDGGQTWSETLEGEIITLAAINPLDPDDIMVSAKTMSPANQKLFRSLNEGQTWTELPMQWNSSAANVTACIAYNPSIAGKIILADQNEIAYSTDNGVSWNHTVYEENVLDVALISPNPFDSMEAIVMTGLHPSRTTDGGITLSRVESPFYLTHNVAVRKGDGNDNLYYSGEKGYMHKNYATGLTSINNTGPDINSAFRNQIMADPHIEGLLVHHDFDPQHPDYKSELHISFDHGATKTLALTLLNSEGFFLPQLMAVSSDPAQPEYVHVILSNGMRCRLYTFDVSDPAEITHETHALPVLTLEFPNNSKILHFGDDFMIINVNNEIHKSTDGGATWAEIFTIADVTAISSIDIDPFSENRVVIATDNGLYESEDNGLTWTLLLEGVNSDKVRFSDAEEGVLAINLIDSEDSFGAKLMYYNASSWLTVSAQELRHINATGMDFSFSQDRINAYISTTDMGIVRYSFEIGELSTEDPIGGKTGFLFYPNPAVDLINIVADEAPVKITVYSLTGRKLHETTSNPVDIASLSKGTYIVQMQASDGRLTSHKIIKK